MIHSQYKYWIEVLPYLTDEWQRPSEIAKKMGRSLQSVSFGLKYGETRGLIDSKPLWRDNGAMDVTGTAYKRKV
jgi:hypothetical protein